MIYGQHGFFKFVRLSRLIIVFLLFVSLVVGSNAAGTSTSRAPISEISGSSPTSVGQASLHTVRMLVPYADLNKVLAERIGKYVMVPYQEYEHLVSEKQAWLSSQTAALVAPPPLENRFISAHIEGRIEGDFARMNAEFDIESLDDGWQTVDLLRGTLAIASATLDGVPIALEPDFDQRSPRVVQFGRRSKAAAISAGLGASPDGSVDNASYRGNTGGSANANSDILRQENWSDLKFRLTFKGVGRKHCAVSFLVPIERQDEHFSMAMSFAKVPLSFIKLDVPDHVIALDDCSLRDYTIDENPMTLSRDQSPSAQNTDVIHSQKDGCSFFGWLGAGGDFRMNWRKKVRRKTESAAVPVTETPTESIPSLSNASGPVKPLASATRPVVIKPVIKPIIYARSETLITLGEGALQGSVDLEYAITKAPVSRFEIMLPDTVEVLSMMADRLETHEIRKEGMQKRLVIDFTASREDKCRISLTFEAKMDDTQGEYKLPEVYPVGVAREIGAIAIQALTSVEVQPALDTQSDASEARRIFRVDVNELPETLAKRSVRPILLAYKHTARPIDLPIVVKRYEDLPQQTVAADLMDAKTAFTTNRSSNTQINLRIRNNNKQYVTFQLATEAEILGAFINGRPVKPVTDKAGGKVLIPLVMSKVFGHPEEMDLRLMYKQEIATMSWRGDLGFTVPTVDIPVSRSAWTLFAPLQYYLYQFSGTVQPSRTPREPFFFRGFLACYDLFMTFAVEPAAWIFLGMFIFGAVLILGHDLVSRLISGIWSVITGLFRFIFGGAAFHLFEICIVLCIIGILGAVSIPNFRKAREQARDKSCYANMRVLLGAIEMYNMDHQVMMGSYSSRDESMLMSGGYLKSHLSKPEPNCEYLSADGSSPG
ncbi:MAG: hypothetical protein HQM09_23270, partial [Candidatus Riflebacteria bacterium]|nr:hypothetical protein [Candidatus Riflebacteria bacterium]